MFPGVAVLLESWLVGISVPTVEGLVGFGCPVVGVSIAHVIRARSDFVHLDSFSRDSLRVGGHTAGTVTVDISNLILVS